MMKVAFRVLAALGTAALSALPALAAAEKYTIDPVHSVVAFKVRHLVAKVPGRFNVVEGTIDVDRENLATAKVSVTIDVASVDTANERRDGHLKSPDFFDAANQPKMTFESTKVELKGEGKALVHGNLTIRGVTKPVVLDTEVLGFGPGMGGMRAGFEATTTINRKDFGVVWNRVLDTGGAVLGDDVEITINVEAVRVEPEKAEESTTKG